ncbi:KPN_02809 family neutral zinc metallopeptidase [Streptococcus parauberis]|uniref:Putative neutral zinc metallopeptidase n=2 Tax=Streptococcus parauberis TaxID=1348 RepID=F1YYE1_9STRE|nr:neutral zinc metallopeptidase [Streptococcus parauberis]EGE53781.1 putative neutral zinc metallopeptidase [Streptococcus parauberis NCFD 2020]OHY30199.1 neutral zinc metallopeptidase [Streptococcus parauberis]PCH12153.1 putative neutral zinc metallopeptidase [Streptococcus parauberis]PIA82912.1 putative neutral zinc metallopeptidase [Streptococcus parauberis]PNY19364.1 putative neutral zinc metallopeptidase [Streptococcus parauberis]
MKTDNMRESSNVEDRRGETSGSSYGGGFGGGGGGGGLGMLLQLLFSRGSWKSKILILIVMLVMGGGGLSGIFTGGGQESTGNNSSYQSTKVTETKSADASEEQVKFVSKVFASTEDYWTQQFEKEGKTYDKPKLVLYTGSIQTACGQGQAAAGPFYCSGDNKVYLDISFYNELSDKYGAAGDFAMAYVIAHEVGHHVQNLLGTTEEYAQARQGKSDTEANHMNVQLELQADYYAGTWAKYVQGEGLLDKGDIEEAMSAANAVGDDKLQKEAYGRTMPDSFTHGTSEQRKRWFDKGLEYGDLQHGDTFAVPYDGL